MLPSRLILTILIIIVFIFAVLVILVTLFVLIIVFHNKKPFILYLQMIANIVFQNRENYTKIFILIFY